MICVLSWLSVLDHSCPSLIPTIITQPRTLSCIYKPTLPIPRAYIAQSLCPGALLSRLTFFCVVRPGVTVRDRIAMAVYTYIPCHTGCEYNQVEVVLVHPGSSQCTFFWFCLQYYTVVER